MSASAMQGGHNEGNTKHWSLITGLASSFLHLPLDSW